MTFMKSIGMHTTDFNRISFVISTLRFPLIAAIVLIHTDMHNIIIGEVEYCPAGKYKDFEIIHHLFTNELARIAVPLYFLISGILFFRKPNWGRAIYLSKLKSRIRSLLIPYLFWNLAIFVVQAVSQWLFPSMLSGRNKLIADFSLLDYIMMFWNHNHTGVPICYQFWFIRDLIVVVILSPIIYWIIKKMPIAIAVIGILWFSDIWPNIIGLGAVSVFFFSLGGWLSINRDKLLKLFGLNNKEIIMTVVCYVLAIAASTFFWSDGNVILYNLMHKAGIIVGIIVLFNGIRYISERITFAPNQFLINSSFFIYGYHGMTVALIMKLYAKLVPWYEGTIILGYFVCWAITILLGLFLYYSMMKLFPKFGIWITGGRG